MKSKETITSENTITELVFLLDRSGSMAGLEDDTIGGFNALVKQHQALEGKAVLSTVLFDHETQILHDRIDVQRVKPLTRDDYFVRGSTALLDAVGDLIQHISRVQHYLPDGYKPDQTIFVITTDGMENASVRYAYEDIRRMIGEREDLGWEFLFLGANIDAAKEAGKIGIDAAHAAQFCLITKAPRLCMGLLSR